MKQMMENVKTSHQKLKKLSIIHAQVGMRNVNFAKLMERNTARKLKCGFVGVTLRIQSYLLKNTNRVM